MEGRDAEDSVVISLQRCMERVIGLHVLYHTAVRHLKTQCGWRRPALRCLLAGGGGSDACSPGPVGLLGSTVSHQHWEERGERATVGGASGASTESSQERGGLGWFRSGHVNAANSTCRWPSSVLHTIHNRQLQYSSRGT